MSLGVEGLLIRSFPREVSSALELSDSITPKEAFVIWHTIFLLFLKL